MKICNTNSNLAIIGDVHICFNTWKCKDHFWRWSQTINGEKSTRNEESNLCNLLRSTEPVKAVKKKRQKTVSVNWFIMKYLLEFFQDVNVNSRLHWYCIFSFSKNYNRFILSNKSHECDRTCTLFSLFAMFDC